MVLQFWTKYLEQSKEVKQNWTEAENFDNCFYKTFDRYYENFISAGTTGRSALSPPNFDIFLIFPNF